MSTKSSLEESITSSLVESFATLLPAGGCFAERGGFFFTKTGLEVNFPVERVEAWLCDGEMEVGGGTELEVGKTLEQTGTGGGGGAVGGDDDGREAGGSGGTGAKGWE